MRYLSVKNLQKYQHYRDRRPPWIKLHVSLFDDYAFQCLQDASKLHLVLFWLLASQMENRIPYDLDYITRKLGTTSPVDVEVLILQGFIEVSQDDGKMLAERKQSAMVETETEAYTKETETEPPKPPGGLSDDEQAVLDHFLAKHPRRRTDPKKAKRYIGGGLKHFSVDQLKRAIDGNAMDPWHVKTRKHELSYILRDQEKISEFIEKADQDPDEDDELLQAALADRAPIPFPAQRVQHVG
jgi:hypothetical protein